VTFKPKPLVEMTTSYWRSWGN